MVYYKLFIVIGVLLSDLLKDLSELYMDDEAAQIRKSAALTCCKILISDPINFQVFCFK